ncbi:hypothetical protein HMPREF1486_01858 [Streptomyces sp. HPH0547]|nr:hypothetical protein HMPREF1486_01858 [Streptomyces sp. HPH0547]
MPARGCRAPWVDARRAAGTGTWRCPRQRDDAQQTVGGGHDTRGIRVPNTRVAGSGRGTAPGGVRTGTPARRRQPAGGRFATQRCALCRGGAQGVADGGRKARHPRDTGCQTRAWQATDAARRPAVCGLEPRHRGGSRRTAGAQHSGVPGAGAVLRAWQTAGGRHDVRDGPPSPHAAGSGRRTRHAPRRARHRAGVRHAGLPGMRGVSGAGAYPGVGTGAPAPGQQSADRGACAPEWRARCRGGVQGVAGAKRTGVPGGAWAAASRAAGGTTPITG